MNDATPVRFGLAGLGGYAGSILSLIESHAKPGPNNEPPLVKLAAAVEPDHVLHADLIARLRGQGVVVVQRYEELLAQPIEALWLPLPIDLHRPYTEQALAAGKAVMCEKPAAGSVQDVDAMIAARDRAQRPALIGYQDCYDPTTLPLKRRLLEGLVGPIRRASVWACWPRSDAYFGRNAWAGKFRRGDTWVMDSPANNALAHYLNIALFLLGDSLHASATPVAVEAELYRVNPIENHDTVSMLLTLPSGATLLVNFTHACEKLVHPVVTLHGDLSLVRRSNERIEIVVDGKTETIERPNTAAACALRKIALLARGKDDPAIGAATLEVARAQTVAVNGASEASAITSVPASATKIVDAQGNKLRTIPGIEDAFAASVERHTILHRTGLLPWTVKPGQRDLRGYKHFSGPKQA
ncbi:MAG: Gfo/Idh/MocA family oxidoreductase [Planctomycetota bacterium]|nr:Gfo/Idh/MocA family oxidoreductase [Planctomycetota bacterium]